MTDVTCPYCKEDQEIDHDDGYGYDEDGDHEQDCSCGKTFKFTTTISYNYEVECQEGEHKMEPFGEKWPDMFQCANCDFYERKESDND